MQDIQHFLSIFDYFSYNEGFSQDRITVTLTSTQVLSSRELPTLVGRLNLERLNSRHADRFRETVRETLIHCGEDGD
jgi:hypothetical protein